MAANMDRDCKLHKKAFDSFCFTHYKACCFSCHSKLLSGKCDIMDEGRATTRLKEDMEKATHILSEITTKLIAEKEVIDERRNNYDEIENNCLSEITKFYDDLKNMMAQCEDRARESVRGKIRERREEMEQDISYVTEAMAEIQLKTPETGRANTEHLYRQTSYIQEVTGTGEHVLESLGASTQEFVVADLKFIGGRCDIDKIADILNSISSTNSCSEGANQGDDEQITEFLRLREINEPKVNYYDIGEKRTRVICDVTAVAYVNNQKNSDLILIIEQKIYIQFLHDHRYRLVRTSEDGAIKYEVDYPCSSDKLHVNVKGEIVSVSTKGNQIAMYNLKDFSPIGTVVVGGKCSSFAALSDRFVVCYSRPSAVRMLTHTGDVVAKSKHAFHTNSSLHVSVTSAEDRVIIMQQSDDNKTCLVILSADLQTTLKTVQLRDAPSSPFAMCTQRSSLYVALGGDTDKSVERYDLDGNYKETILTGLTGVCGLAYNEELNNILVLSKEKQSGHRVNNHIYVYKGHIY